MQYAPCTNPECRNYGKPHPNCRDYENVSPSQLASEGYLMPGTTRGMKRQAGGHYESESGPASGAFAHGGMVHECSGSDTHHADCHFHLAEGGQIPEQPAQISPSPDDPSDTLGHAAIEHGLVGLLDGAVGNATLLHPEKHAKVIDEAKAQHRFRQLPIPADGLMEAPPKKTIGSQLGSHIFDANHEGSSELMKEHPLVGSAKNTDLHSTMGRLSQGMIDKETHPEAFRGAADYLHASARGKSRLDKEVESVMGEHREPTHLEEMSKESSRKELNDRLDSINSNPAQLLDVAGNLGHYLPNHAAQMGAMSAQAVHYLNNLKPKPIQNGALDEPSPPSPMSKDLYDRQLDIANQPLSIFGHIKNGTLQQEDLTTLSTIYPGLHKSIVKKLGEQLITSKSKNEEIPYKQRMALSLIMGEALDSTLSQQSMMAVITSAPNQPEPQQAPKKSHSGATAQTQKTMDKVDDLYQTPLDKLQIDKK